MNSGRLTCFLLRCDAFSIADEGVELFNQREREFLFDIDKSCDMIDSMCNWLKFQNHQQTYWIQSLFPTGGRNTAVVNVIKTINRIDSTDESGMPQYDQQTKQLCSPWQQHCYCGFHHGPSVERGQISSLRLIPFFPPWLWEKWKDIITRLCFVKSLWQNLHKLCGSNLCGSLQCADVRKPQAKHSQVLKETVASGAAGNIYAQLRVN